MWRGVATGHCDVDGKERGGERKRKYYKCELWGGRKRWEGWTDQRCGRRVRYGRVLEDGGRGEGDTG